MKKIDRALEWLMVIARTADYLENERTDRDDRRIACGLLVH